MTQFKVIKMANFKIYFTELKIQDVDLCHQ